MSNIARIEFLDELNEKGTYVQPFLDEDRTWKSRFYFSILRQAI